jgi:beta-1,4-N-acetylglucosaminyltransferase
MASGPRDAYSITPKMSAEAPSPQRRLCFITVGATASFNSLLTAALDKTFLQSLRTAGFTDLLLQYGKDASIFNSFIMSHPEGAEGRCGLNISGFDFNKKGLGQEMRAAKGEDGRLEGIVISHAGG